MSEQAAPLHPAGGPARAHVAIVGAGLMGAQIGCEYALGGCHVTWIVRDRTRAEQRVEGALELALGHGLADEQALARARTSMTYGDGDARSPDLIVESLPEDLSLKADALGAVAARHPQATVASNTSSISISALGDAAGIGERIVGTHYWNPPLLMPLVETIAGAHTPRELLVGVLELLRAIGKRPVEQAAARRAARVRVARRPWCGNAADDRRGDARRPGTPLAADRPVRDGRPRRRADVRRDRREPVPAAVQRDVGSRLRTPRAERPGAAREPARATRRGARGGAAGRTRAPSAVTVARRPAARHRTAVPCRLYRLIDMAKTTAT
jgi:hypothetical protein